MYVNLVASTTLSGWSGATPFTTITFEWQRATLPGSGCPSSGSNSWGTFATNTVAATSPVTTDTLNGADNFCYRVRVRGTNAVGTGGNSNFSLSVRVT